MKYKRAALSNDDYPMLAQNLVYFGLHLSELVGVGTEKTQNTMKNRDFKLSKSPVAHPRIDRFC